MYAIAQENLWEIKTLFDAPFKKFNLHSCWQLQFADESFDISNYIKT